MLSFIKKIKPHQPILIIIALSILPYITIPFAPLIWDDFDFITKWTTIRQPLINALPLIKGHLPDGHGGVYRPTRSFLYAATFALSRTNPLGYHLVSLIIHALTTLTIYYLIRHLAPQKKHLALITSLLFATHPIHTQSISWITASFDAFSIMLILLSFLFYLRSSSRPKLYFLSLFLALTGFFGYELALMLPAILISHRWLIQRKSLLQSLFYFPHYPYYFLFLFYWYIRFQIQTPTRGEILGGSYLITFITMIKAMFLYLKLHFFPLKLSLIHLLPKGIYTTNVGENHLLALTSQSVIKPDFFVPLIILTLIIIFSLLYHRKKPLLVFAVSWFFIFLLPVMQIFPNVSILTEYYPYAASLGFCLFLGIILSRLTHSRPLLGSGVTLTIILTYSILTWQRNRFWHNEIRLWEHALTIAPHSALAHTNLGKLYQFQNDYQTAHYHYQQALTYNPQCALCHTNQGVIYQLEDQLHAAADAHQQALNIDPTLKEAYNNFGILKHQLGDNQAAEQLLRQAIKLDPDYADAYNNLGNVYITNNHYQTAAIFFEKALSINPQDQNAHKNYQKTLRIINANSPILP